MAEVTSRSAIVEQVIEGLQGIKKLILRNRPDDLEVTLDYIDTIENFTIANIKENPSELPRISAMLNVLKKKIGNDKSMDAVHLRIDIVRGLVQVAIREFKLKETG